jgi:hypothetical protein
MVSNSSRQTQRCLSLPNQDSMNAWDSGSRWPPRRCVTPCSARRARNHAGERRPGVGAERQRPGADAALSDGGVEDGDRLVGAAADVKRRSGDLAGAASIAAFR